MYKGCAHMGQERNERGVFFLLSTTRKTAPFKEGWIKCVSPPAQNTSRTEMAGNPKREGNVPERKYGNSSNRRSISAMNLEGGRGRRAESSASFGLLSRGMGICPK